MNSLNIRAYTESLSLLRDSVLCLDEIAGDPDLGAATAAALRAIEAKLEVAWIVLTDRTETRHFRYHDLMPVETVELDAAIEEYMRTPVPVRGHVTTLDPHQSAHQSGVNFGGLQVWEHSRGPSAAGYAIQAHADGRSDDPLASSLLPAPNVGGPARQRGQGPVA